MGKRYFLGGILIVFIILPLLGLNMVPYQWNTIVYQDQFTGRKEVFIKADADNSRVFGFRCDERKIKLIYQLKMDYSSEIQKDVGDLFVKVGSHPPVKIKSALLTVRDGYTTIYVVDNDHQQEFNNILNQLNLFNGIIIVGYRGLQNSDDFTLGNDGLGTSLSKFITECKIHLDGEPEND